MKWVTSFLNFFKSLYDHVVGFFRGIYDLFADFIQHLFQTIEDFVELEYFMLSQNLTNWFMDLEPPEFFNTASQVLNSVPESVVYFADSFALDLGITMILSAYLIRFVIRRLPIFG